MDSLFFWIIVLSFLVPVAMRLYRKSVGRNQDKGITGDFPGQPGSGFPGQFPGGTPGRNKKPGDGYTQQDYFRGGFEQAGGGRPAADPPAPHIPYPDQQYPGQPGYQAPVPYEDSPEYLDRPPASGQAPSGQQRGPAVPPPVPPVPSGPQGYRARRLAELDERYSNGELNLQDYMAQRAEIMKG